MAEQEWSVISTKVNEVTKNAVDIHCSQLSKKGKKMTPSKLLNNLLKEEVGYLLDSSVLPKNKGIPEAGKHFIEYNKEEDSFTWKIKTESNIIHTLAENISPRFLEVLNSEISKAVLKRNKTLENLENSGQFYVPNNIVNKFEVRE